MAFEAKYPGTCYRCKGPIVPGQMISQMNRPQPKTRFHESCPKAAETQAAETTQTQARTPPEVKIVLEAQTTQEKIRDIITVEPAIPGSIDEIIERRILGHLQGFNPKALINEDRIRDLIREYATQTQEIVIKRHDGTSAKVEGAHYLMERALRLLGAGVSLYFWGPAGTGKTTMALQAAKALGLEAELDTLDPSTPKSGILGYRTPTGDPVWTATLRRYAEGGILVWDEMDNAPGHVQNVGNSMLANGHAPAAWGMVPRHALFGFVGTGNTPGRPTPQFPDRRVMSAAFADRLYFVYVPLDPNIERRATGRSPARVPARLGTVRDVSPAAWGRWVEEIRAWAVKGAPTIQVTPRATLIGLVALAAGETPEEVAHGLVFRGADEALVAKALEACPLPS